VFSGGNAAVWRRAVVAGLVGAVMGLAGAAPAVADEPVTAKPRGGDAYGYVRLEGFDRPVDVGPLALDFDGEKADAYCIDLHHPVALNVDYHEGTWSQAEVKNLGKVQWVLLHGYPQRSGAALLEAAGATAAGISDARLKQLFYIGTQVSVWHFSDGAVLTGPGERRGRPGYGNGEFAVVKKVYDHLTSKATDAPEPKAELTIAPASRTAAADSKAGPFTVTGPSGPIALTVTGGTAVDGEGRTVTGVTNGGTFWLGRDGAGEVSAVAKTTATHSTGRVFLFKGKQKRQKLILAGTAGDDLTATAKADFTRTPKPTPSPTPSTSATPAPTPSASTSATPSVSPSTPAGGEGGSDGGSGDGGSGDGGSGDGGTLPKTGASTMLIVGAGVLLLGAGAVAVLIVRRRKVSFTV
jgi:TQXA domain-containing protein/LPXTG-motif cell wall-anchored protein